MERNLEKLQAAIKAQFWPFATVHETIPFKHLDGRTLLYVHTNEHHIRPDELLGLASMVDVCHISTDEGCTQLGVHEDSTKLVVTCMWHQDDTHGADAPTEPAAPTHDVKPKTTASV